MQAIRVHAPGPAEVLRWEETATPEPSAGEVLVRLKAAAVNHLDIWMRLGSVFAPMPIVPGCEGAGIVEQTGSGVTGFQKGDEVVVTPWIFPDRPYTDPPNLSVRIFGVARDGCYAEYVAAPAHALLRKPARLGFEEAASVPLTTTTAYRMAITRGNLQPGETVLVVGATGGIGVAAIQLAHAMGARVFATTRDTRKGTRLYDLGADAVIDSGSDFSAETRLSRPTAGSTSSWKPSEMQRGSAASLPSGEAAESPSAAPPRAPRSTSTSRKSTGRRSPPSARTEAPRKRSAGPSDSWRKGSSAPSSTP